MNKFVFTVLQLVLLIDSTKQSRVKQAITTVKAIGKTIKSPIIKTLGNTMKNSISMFCRNKSTIKNIAFGLQETYLKAGHNFGSKSVKYLGREAIKKFKYMAPYAAKGGNQLIRAPSKQNIQMRSAAQIGGKDLSSLLNMVSKSKPQLPFLVGGSLMRLTQVNLVPDQLEKDLAQVKKDSVHVKKEHLPIWHEDWVDTKPNKYVPDKKKFWEPRVIHPPEGTMIDGKLHQQGRIDYGEETGYYEGEIVDGKAHGKGRYTYMEGGYYEGDFVNGQMEGHIALTHLNGETYEGGFLNKQAHGYGVLDMTEGIGYRGDFVHAQKHGKGIETIWNTELFNGTFMKGGERWETLTDDDIVTYKGEYVNNEFEGKGKLSHVDGTTYEGDFLAGKASGKGKYTYKDGSTYIGEWLDNKKHGYGEKFDKNSDHYQGEWKDDEYAGEGTFFMKYEDHFKPILMEDGKPIQ